MNLVIDDAEDSHEPVPLHMFPSAALCCACARG